MNPRLKFVAVVGIFTLVACADESTAPISASGPSLAASSASANVGINVVLKSRPTSAQLAQLAALGTVAHQFTEINGLTLRANAGQLRAIRALPFVKAAALDVEVHIPPPTDLVPLTDFTGGISTWDQDAIDVTIRPFSSAREVSQTGEGVYVGVLDSGLLYTWRQYFPEERIATQYARAFVGGGALDRGAIVSPPDLWEHDVCSHGTHVTSTILGFRYAPLGIYVQGTAPRATVIPVKGLVQGGPDCFGWSSALAAGILYFAQLKQGPLAGHPLVVNNSWGSRVPDPLTQAAIDYAIAHGVLFVFSAGNAGEAGMGYPGAYPPVISAAASGWVGEWVANGEFDTRPRTWWYAEDVRDPTNPADFYIADFSSREKPGQDLDVAAPGSWVLGPFQTQRGKADYFFLGGTSMAAPHVTGTVALMLQKRPSLTQSQAEAILESTAIPLAPGCRSVFDPFTATRSQICWGADATGSGLLQADAAVAATP